MKRIFRIVLYLFSPFMIYLLLALLGSLIPICGSKIAEIKEIKIFVQTNGMHTSIVLPLENTKQNWLDKLDSTFQKYQSFKYVAFGWGDEEFYRASKTKITAWHIFNALFLPSKTLIQMKFYDFEPQITTQRISISISKKQYQVLSEWIEDQIIKQENGDFSLISQGYGSNDYFFRATGKYHLFNTCNNWTGRALKKTGVCTSLWSPFDFGIFWHLK